MILILGTVSFVYLLPSIYNGSNDEVDSFSRKRQVHVDAFDQSKGVAADVDKKFAQQAIDSIKKKANEYIKEQGVSFISRMHHVITLGLWSKYDVHGHYFRFAVRIKSLRLHLVFSDFNIPLLLLFDKKYSIGL